MVAIFGLDKFMVPQTGGWRGAGAALPPIFCPFDKRQYRQRNEINTDRTSRDDQW